MSRCRVGCDTRPVCAGTTAGGPQSGWPHVFEYHLAEQRSNERGSNPQLTNRLVEAGVDTNAYRRIEEGANANFCISPVPLNAETRHHLLAEMLRSSNKPITWARKWT